MIRRIITVSVVGLGLVVGMLGISQTKPAYAATQCVVASHDTYSKQQAPSTPYGSEVRFSTQGNSGWLRHSYLKFPAISLKSGETITSATLKAESLSTSSIGVDVYNTANSWNESTLTWNNQPTSGAFIANSGAFALDEVVSWDVTSSVVAASGDISFQLKSADTAWLGFDSKESNSTQKPQLCYTTAQPTVTNIAVSADSYVGADASTTNYGSSKALYADSSPDKRAYLKFDLSGISGTITGAKLKFTTDSSTWSGSPDAQSIKYVSNDTWTEQGLTFDNKPSSGATVGTLAAGSVGSSTSYSIDLDVSPFAGKAGQTVSLAIENTGSDAFYIQSREASVAPVLEVTTGGGTTPNPDPDPNQDPEPNPAGDIKVGAVGDINNLGNSSTSSRQGVLAAHMANANLDAILALGDFQYEYGTCAEYVNSFDKTGWGALMPKVIGTAGATHDYTATKSSDYSQHMEGTCPGQTSGPSLSAVSWPETIQPYKPHYVDLGAWTIISMPSAQGRSGYNVYGSSYTISNLANWLDTELTNAENRGDHVAVIMHDPYWTQPTSGHPKTEADYVKPWIDVMDAHDTPLMLAAHQHNYERFHPMNANSTRNDATGIQQFQVSTGGKSLRAFTGTEVNLAAATDKTEAGWLELTLKASGGYDWKFHTTSGTPFIDTGSR